MLGRLISGIVLATYTDNSSLNKTKMYHDTAINDTDTE
jgi:hypothetical protein